MASLHTCMPPFYSIGIFRRPSAGICIPSLTALTPTFHGFNGSRNLRFRKELKLQVKKRLSHTSASNTNPPQNSDDTKSIDDVPGPPLLTILAGVIVFLFISWILGSIVMWIIGIILHPPLPK